MITIQLSARFNHATGKTTIIDARSGVALFEATEAVADLDIDPVDLANYIVENLDDITLEQESDLYDMEDVEWPYGDSTALVRQPRMTQAEIDALNEAHATAAKRYFMGELEKLPLLPGKYKIDLTAEDGSEVIGFVGDSGLEIEAAISDEAYRNNWIVSRKQAGE